MNTEPTFAQKILIFGFYEAAQHIARVNAMTIPEAAQQPERPKERRIQIVSNAGSDEQNAG